MNGSNRIWLSVSFTSIPVEQHNQFWFFWYHNNNKTDIYIYKAMVKRSSLLIVICDRICRKDESLVSIIKKYCMNGVKKKNWNKCFPSFLTLLFVILTKKTNLSQFGSVYKLCLNKAFVNYVMEILSVLMSSKFTFCLSNLIWMYPQYCRCSKSVSFRANKTNDIHKYWIC